LHTESDGIVIREIIKSSRGNYGDFYEGIYQALTAEQPVPVSAEEGIGIISIIEAAICSNKEKRVVEI